MWWIQSGMRDGSDQKTCFVMDIQYLSMTKWLQTGLTPLMEAASGGYVEVGRVLLDKGGDVNAPPVPSSRDTALTIAADKGHYRFVELLLSRHSAVDVKNKKGNSPLWLACNGVCSCFSTLLLTVSYSPCLSLLYRYIMWFQSEVCLKNGCYYTDIC